MLIVEKHFFLISVSFFKLVLKYISITLELCMHLKTEILLCLAFFLVKADCRAMYFDRILDCVNFDSDDDRCV